MKRLWPYVFQGKDGTWWCDTGTKLETRKRKRCTSQEEAIEQSKAWKKEFASGGTAAFLTDDQRLDAVNAIRMLEKAGVKDNLQMSVKFYLEHQYPSGGDPKLRDAIADFIAEKTADRENTQVYLYSLNRLERLIEYFDPPEKKKPTSLSEISKTELLEHVYTGKKKTGDKSDWSEETRKQMFRYYRMFFKWCVSKKYMVENPLDKTKQPKGRGEPPEVIWTEDCATLLSHAWKQVENAAASGIADPFTQEAWKLDDCEHRFFPYLVLGLFSGIRPHEINRLQWRNINATTSSIQVHERASKTQQHRNVPIPLNAQLMLDAYVDKVCIMQPLPHPDYPILGGYWDYFKFKFRNWRRRIGVNRWPHDGMRHTFASQFLAYENDLTKVQNRLGHGTSRMTLQHYVHLVDQTYAKDFWTLMPNEHLKNKLLGRIAGLDEEKQKKLLLQL